MTSKERAKLKSIASKMDAILQIGKNPIGSAFLKQVDDALAAREMIKIHVLETCELTPAETALALEKAADCQAVQVIGSKVILFRQRQKGDKRGSYLDNDKPAAASEERGRKAKANVTKKTDRRAGAKVTQKSGSEFRTNVKNIKDASAKRRYKGGYTSGKRTGKK